MRTLTNIGILMGLGSAFLLSCVTLKQNQLYVDNSNPTDTIFYTSSEIYTGYITSEAWATDITRCISVSAIKEAAYRGDLGMRLKWNKTLDGCPWLGIGFGWDNWTGKDLSEIRYTGALEFHVRMVEGERDVLPWALGFEDFTGAQAWTGMSSNAIKAEKVTTEWTRVEIPIAEFDWMDQGADITDIKQLIFQLEADGEVDIDEIRIVPYSGGFRKRANIVQLDAGGFKADGDTTDAIWNTPPLLFRDNRVHMAIVGDKICFALMTKDEDPLQNSQTGRDIWNGDCFEIAFSAVSSTNQRTSYYRTTDQHIGFALGDVIQVWDWMGEKALSNKETATRKTADGYIFEGSLSFTELGIPPPQEGVVYGMETAVDHGDKESRYRQDRWNNQSNDEFYKNPSLWGELYIIPKKNEN